MPGVDGLTLVRFYRANPSTREIPLIVLSSQEDPAIKAEAFLKGANDYLVKLPDPVEMVARIRYHAKGYLAQMERNEANRRLAESQLQLAREISEAAKYVRSMLPPPLLHGPVRVDWRFVPSSQLAGDSFGYHWLDQDHFAVYLLDVCGHGVGSALLSVSALDVLRSHSLRDTDFREPAQVLEGLNRTFDMDRHDGKFFSIWYGVFNQSTKELRYAGGGHPPVLLYPGFDRRSPLVRLESSGPLIGVMPGIPFPTETVALGAAATMYLFSDGVYEVEQQDGQIWRLEDLSDFLSAVPADTCAMDALLDHLYSLKGDRQLDDDFSMLEIGWLGRRRDDRPRTPPG